MQKALIGAAKISVGLGALALVLAFLGLYVVPAFAISGNEGPIFSGNVTSFASGLQYRTGMNYGFETTIHNDTGVSNAIINITFRIGRPNGLYQQISNSTTNITTNPNLTYITRGSDVLVWVNFTQETLGPASAVAYNYSWFANATAGAGFKENNTQSVPFLVAQNASIGRFLTLRLDNVSTNFTHARNTIPLNITADLNSSVNSTGGAANNIVSIYFNGSAITDTDTLNSRAENSTFTLRAQTFGIYEFNASVANGENYSASASNYTLYLTLNSSTINLIMNLTYVNASGYVSDISAIGALAPQFLAQAVFTPYETGCTGNTTNFSSSSATISLNNTCNYTATVTMTDFISVTNQIFNSTFVIGKLNMTSGGSPISTDIQLVPMGTYGKASPSLKSILGGFAFNDTNIRATSSYQNVTFAIARRGYMPDGLYKCANWSQATIGSNAQVCSNWASATTPLTDSTSSNTTYLNKTITAQNFTFYGYSEPFYNLRPLVKAYGNASNITTMNIVNWANFRTKYYSWVPMTKFNMTSKQPYLPSSDAYAESMYYDVPFFANPSAIEMLAYNFTVNINFSSQAYNQTFGVSITPRIIRSGQDLLSGAETPLMPAWSVQDTDSFEGASVTRTILRPTFNTLYYTYNGTTCGPYLNQSYIGPGSNSPNVNFYNSLMAFPCSKNLSYDYSTNEMNFTVSNENVTDTSLSVLFSLAGRPTSGMYSPVYLVNQTFIGGFIPGPGREPPAPGAASGISFVVKVNNSLSNFTSTAGTDMFVHFLYPKNVTVWQNSSLSTINMTANMGSDFQLWQLNDTISAAVAGAVNASASNDVNTTSTGNSWMMIANETHLWNSTTLTYNTMIPVSSVSGMFVNRTFSCNNVTESFPGSPSNGKNLTICFQEFDFNLTAINGWLPNDPKSNVTLNLTATLNVSILNEIKLATGAAGSTNHYNASISTASTGEIKLGETQLPGFNAANCGADFSNCTKTIIVDGSALNSSSYRTGSIILNLASGTHAVSVTYTVPAAAAAATTTTSTSSGSSSTTASDIVTGKLTKTFTSIASYAPRTITESELSGTNTGLTQIDISVKNIATNVKITVEKLAGKPASITQEVVSANGKVYKFMNITKENLADSDMDKAKIKFKIEKSWLNANNFSALQIVLKRFTAQWDSLNTSMTSEDTSYAYYSADSPGFSVFAVAADKNVVTPVQPEQPTQPTTPVQPQQPAGQQPPAQQDVVPYIAALVLIIVVFAVAARYFEKGKKKK